MFKNASDLSLVAFLTIAVGIVVSIIVATLKSGQSKAIGRRQAMQVGLLIVAWLSLLCIPVASGFLEAQPMPRMLVFFAISNLAAIVFALSPYGKRLATGLSFGVLVAFQGFRFPLELVLHAWVTQGVIPQTMTWSGQNFDIVTGMLAIIAASISNRVRAIAWGFNIVGFALLLNVMRVAALSSPLPFAWHVTPPLELLFHVPYFLIVPVCVAGALAGHIVLTRKLMNK